MPVENRLDFLTRVGFAQGNATDSRQRENEKALKVCTVKAFNIILVVPLGFEPRTP